MTTINTIEDLIRLLDENPQWVEALRSRLLTRELLELPEKFAEFVAATNARFDRLEQRFDGLEQRFEESTAANNVRFDGLEQRFEESTAANNVRFDRIDNAIRRIQNDMGNLRGAHARNAAIHEAALIARSLGLRQIKNLTPRDLLEMADAVDTSDIPDNVLDSFFRADLIIECTDSQGETCYIAVEISFTANGRDTTRAVRNSGLLTRFTGKTAHASVSGLYQDDRIQSSIDSGEIFWYQLDQSALEVE